MSSLSKLNQFSAKLTIPRAEPILKEEARIALEIRDREIYALRQQLQALKKLYKDAKTQSFVSQKKSYEASPDSEYSKQRIEKLMAALAEREKQMHYQEQEFKQQQALIIDAWQKELRAKQVACNETAALHGQVELLKNKLANCQNTIKEQQLQIQATAEELIQANSQLQTTAAISAEKEELEKILADAKEQKLEELKSLEDKIFQMKSMWMNFGKLFGDHSSFSVIDPAPREDCPS